VRCNDHGQVYGGTVIAVVDATTSSAGDLFAAGFADNEVGTIVSVGRARGAGGANVWRSDVLR
jgi:C-terminal processing protease CtpA/Prc